MRAAWRRFSARSSPRPRRRACRGISGQRVPAAECRRFAEAELRGDRPDFLFFWGHRPQRDGGIGPGCLSQWWPAPFGFGGVTYPTAEHFMMAGKARLFGDEGMASRIIEASSPGRCEGAGAGGPGLRREAVGSKPLRDRGRGEYR